MMDRREARPVRTAATYRVSIHSIESACRPPAMIINHHGHPCEPAGPVQGGQWRRGVRRAATHPVSTHSTESACRPQVMIINHPNPPCEPVRSHIVMDRTQSTLSRKESHKVRRFKQLRRHAAIIVPFKLPLPRHLGAPQIPHNTFAHVA